MGISSLLIALALFSYCTFLGVKYYDTRTWAAAAVEYRDTGEISSQHPIFGYPGLSIIIPASYLTNIFQEDTSLAISVVMIVELSVIIAALVMMTYLLRPQSLWWLFVAIALLCDIASFLLFRATPASALAGVLIPLIILSVWYVFEEGGSWHMRCLLSIGILLLILTRYDLGGVILLSMFIFLLFFDRRAAIMIALSGILGILINPLWWSEPVVYLQNYIEKLTAHYQKEGGLTLWQLFYSSPLSFVGISIAFYNATIQKYDKDIPKKFLWWILTVSVIIFWLLWLSAYHPIWYFLPLIIIWQIIFPLYLLRYSQGRVQPEHMVLAYAVFSFVMMFFILPYSVAWA